MKITLTDGTNFVNIEVDPDQLIEDVKALLESEVIISLFRPVYQWIRSNCIIKVSLFMTIRHFLNEK